MKTLFVTDLDGTLLTKEERISAYSLAHLNRLLERGMPFTVATARSIKSTESALYGLNITVPAILYNGGLIYDFGHKERIREIMFGDDVKRYLFTVLQEHGIAPFVFGQARGKERVVWQRGGETEGMARYLRRRNGDERFEPVCNDGELLEGMVYNFKCIGPRERLECAWNILKYDSRIICIFHRETYQNDFWMEISPREANKASAVSYLKNKLGFEKVICFGDTSNDSDMFDVCDEKYAVLNADEWLKDKATGIIGYCEEDGVAKWLESNSGF